MLRTCVHTGVVPVACAQGDVSVELGLKGGAAITADAAISLLINTDPRGDGIGGGQTFFAAELTGCGPSMHWSQIRQRRRFGRVIPQVVSG